jgi:hypothetical protein
MLITEPNLGDHDGFYQALIDLHRGLDEAGSSALNARLVLVLSNHVGDPATLRQAFEVARASMPA